MTSAPDWQPTLIGEHILVRPLSPTDWAELFAAASDPEIWALHPARDRYQEPVFRAFFDDALQARSAFAVVERQTGAIIGSSRYHGYDPSRREVEIGWTFLVRKHWGGATNAELKRLMLEHAFRYVDRVLFMVGPSNWRSRRALEKIGAILRDAPVELRLGDRMVTHVVYEIAHTLRQVICVKG